MGEPLLFEVDLNMGAVIKIDPGAPSKWIAGKGRMAIGKTGELEGMAVLALKICQPDQVALLAFMLGQQNLWVNSSGSGSLPNV